MNVGIDLDNVLNENALCMIDYARYKYNIKGVTIDDFKSYFVETCTPITIDMLYAMFNDPYYFYTIPPYRNMVSLVNKLSAKGIGISIVTDRPEHCMDATVGWLDKYVDYTNIFIKKAVEKASLAKSLNIKFFIEDRLDTAVDLSNVCETVYLLDSPWNQDFNLPHNLIRFKKYTSYEENKIYREIMDYATQEKSIA